MKSLQSYIVLRESRGIVTDTNSWAKTVYYIIRSGKDEIKDNLAPWMNSVHIIHSEWGIPTYKDDLSKIVDGKLDITIDIPTTSKQDLLETTLEHEFQHAFDDWIARTKRGRSNEMSDKYCIGTGYEMDDVGVGSLVDDPKEVTCDTFFTLFKYCTYFFEETEVNAYCREMSLYLDKHELDFNKLFDDSSLQNRCGGGPLYWIHVLKSVFKNYNKYIVDPDHVDWDYIVQGLHDRWSKQYLGRNIEGLDTTDTVLKTIQYILDKPAKYCIKKFSRTIRDHSNKVKNAPDWLI